MNARRRPFVFAAVSLFALSSVARASDTINLLVPKGPRTITYARPAPGSRVSWVRLRPAATPGERAAKRWSSPSVTNCIALTSSRRARA